MSETTPPQVAVAETGNTIPAPPRLNGEPTADLQAMNAWVGDLHRTLAREANVVGTQRILIAAVNQLLTRVATLEARADASEQVIVALDQALALLQARVDSDAALFDALPFMPGTVSGTYVAAELAAAYDKINAAIAILRNP